MEFQSDIIDTLESEEPNFTSYALTLWPTNNNPSVGTLNEDINITSINTNITDANYIAIGYFPHRFSSTQASLINIEAITTNSEDKSCTLYTNTNDKIFLNSKGNGRIEIKTTGNNTKDISIISNSNGIVSLQGIMTAIINGNIYAEAPNSSNLSITGNITGFVSIYGNEKIIIGDQNTEMLIDEISGNSTGEIYLISSVIKSNADKVNITGNNITFDADYIGTQEVPIRIQANGTINTGDANPVYIIEE